MINFDEIKRLYFEESKSSYQIAKIMGISSSYVLYLLKKNGSITRKNLGFKAETEVAKWYRKKGHRVVHQSYGSPYDLLVDGERVDVKSSSLGINRNNNYSRYMFQLKDRSKRVKEKILSKEIDWFLLVFKDKRAMYKIKPSDLNCECSLTIPEDISKSECPLQFVGYLKERQ